MINPSTITNFNRTHEELEEFLLFTIMVAGKNAKMTSIKLDQFLESRKKFCVDEYTPFEFIEYLEKNNLLDVAIRSCKLGQYNRLKTAFIEITKFKQKLPNVSVSELESIKGIGPKTARFFALHSRPKINHAVLDTHILKWLRDHGIDAPKTTPTGKKYLELEKKFLTYSKEYGIEPAELDLQIWKSYSKTK